MIYNINKADLAAGYIIGMFAENFMSVPININDDIHQKIISLLKSGWVSCQEIRRILGEVSPIVLTNHINTISTKYTVSERMGVYGIEYKILTKEDYEMYEQRRQLKMKLGIKEKAVHGTAKK